MYFTLIGSRETPKEDYKNLITLSEELLDKGWVGRSGGAAGADSALEEAFNSDNHEIEVYLPWDGFNNKFDNGVSYFNISKHHQRLEAEKIVSETHPAWNVIKANGDPVLTRGVKALHIRNVFQLLGYNLKRKSDVVICWAVPKGNGVSGGTNTAVQLAHKHQVPVVNLYGKTLEMVLLELQNLGIDLYTKENT